MNWVVLVVFSRLAAFIDDIDEMMAMDSDAFWETGQRFIDDMEGDA